MADLKFGLIVTAIVIVAVALVGGVTAMYCRWAERSDRSEQTRTRHAA